MSEKESKMRDGIFRYMSLKSQIENLEAEQTIVKAELEKVMTELGITEFEAPAGKVKEQVKYKYEFDCGLILQHAPEASKYMSMTNENFNKVLVGREALIGVARKVVDTIRNLVITKPRAAKK